jgi:hypothetical protein
VKFFLFALVVAAAIGISFGVACVIAWAIVSIWPSVPFWPAALGCLALAALFGRGGSK